MCNMHYQRWRAHGSTDEPWRYCETAGCGRRVRDYRWCAVHYRENVYGIAPPRPRVVEPLITHDCPNCEDGGLVVPYDADERGQIKTYRCVVRGCWTIVRGKVNA